MTPKQPSNHKNSPSDRKLASSSAESGKRQNPTLEEAQIQVGAFVRATRQAQNLTQAEVAARTRGTPFQLSRAAVSAIERGQNFPGLEAMLALSSVLQIDPKEFIERARLTVVPIEVEGRSVDELEKQASQFFWAGDFKRALSIYDNVLERISAESDETEEHAALTMAEVEIRRATALKRSGALLSAISSAERALILAKDHAQTLAEAYVVLADLQVHRGHLPLASDAARRAIDLAGEASETIQGWAWMVQGRVSYLAGDFAEAREAFLKARGLALRGHDEQHLTHIEGNIGLCWVREGNFEEGRRSLEQAVEFARKSKQPILEASFSIELGKLALSAGRLDVARQRAEDALRIARPRNHTMSIFRAGWLLHKLSQREDPENSDRERLEELGRLYLELEGHEGIDEVKEFRAVMAREAVS